jgi:hypothetical protein
LFEIEAPAELLGERTHQAQASARAHCRVKAFRQSDAVVVNLNHQAALRSVARRDADLAGNAGGMRIFERVGYGFADEKPDGNALPGDVR